ncbi:putative ankyrin repeat protein RF_0381, partial [Saccostrea cucullata]|uniref:putative ankyrin repeat protein RF_0381 n=1 Tax=Saccostrea cuccullata TaxID=36930 RepID=UPI002ED67262
MDDTTFEEVSSSIKNSIESIANRCGDEVHSKVKGEIEKLMKSQMNDNMGRHVLSSLHNLEENFEDISQDMKDIKSHLGIREKLNVSHENIYEEPPRRNATKTSLSLYETTPPEISRYEKIVADIHEARYTDCNFQYYMDKIFETSNFLRQTNREGFFDIDLAVENENLKIIHVLSIYWRYSKRLPPEICIFLCACKKGFIHIMEYILKKNGDILHKTDLRGWNAAHYAAQGGHIKLLELLLDKGVRFDQTTNEKESILHIASLNAKFEMCQFIITKFPQMRQECDKNGQNAIHLAALGGNIKILQFLVDKGVEIYQSNNKNSTVLHAACRNAHYDMSKYILCKYPEMLNLYNTDGWNAAHFAARGGEVKILQMLINEGEEIKLTYAERNILHIACQYAHFDMCNYILSKFPKMLECKCEDGWIAIHFAAKGGNRKILQMLLEKGALEKEITSAKKSILHIACVSSHYDICEYIVTNYPDILHWDDASGRNAVHFAAQGGNINILNLLLKNNANAKTITNTKKNILHIACENEKYDMCKKILYHFPDMLGKVDEVGRNAAHCAACGNNVNLLQLLIEKGVKADQTIDGEINILQLACSYGKYEMCQYILSKYPEMLKSCDAKGWNPAHYAALGGHVHILMLLVEKGINANHKLKGGMTILHIACANARYEMCQYILSEIPNMISEVDIRGRNAAHYAILQDNLGILKLLIEKELPNTNYQDNILNSVCAYARFDMCEYILSKYPNTINLVNKKGWNAAHSAARGGNVKILQLLLEKGIKANETTCDEENILDIA